MYYTVYKITNLLDGKFYIGKHKTKNLDDGYMGSGYLIKRAIKKHGLENFKKEILEVFSTEEEMNEAEKKLVVLGEKSYNLCPGGQGGFGYINENKCLQRKYGVSNASQLPHVRKITSLRVKQLNTEGRMGFGANPYDWTGKKHTEEAKAKIGSSNSISQSGSKNSQFGTFWITDGVSSRKIKRDDPIPDGWTKGRKIPLQSSKTMLE